MAVSLFQSAGILEPQMIPSGTYNSETLLLLQVEAQWVLTVCCDVLRKHKYCDSLPAHSGTVQVSPSY